jgi:AcrR family transcriptional regulator
MTKESHPIAVEKIKTASKSGSAIAVTGPDRAAAEIVGRGDKLIAAAYEQLSECGLEGLTVRPVLERAGLNRRAFYERFTGKDDLVLAVFTQALQSVADECRAAAERLRDPMETLRFMVRHLVVADTIDPRRKVGAALCREHIKLAAARPNELRLALQPLIAVFSAQLAAAMSSGQVRDGSPDQLAYFIYNLVSTTAHAEILAGETKRPTAASRAKLADELWEFCRCAISA